ncbi:DUF4267 domain-containing protein [Streptomyces sp. NBC_00237]|uniref:DUF4267 domain-containing protein n=1 Tax=Streptomyces sp. NBC_00237 TaxID=2975687 RepID=UPI002250B6A8|nr:DUF4267 domain-containing protein [Streptomyces sp. NBC_00237]MCX5200332.1 DUF4267 domain-containing protein [Streptomyces sp. NBC_00237]
MLLKKINTALVAVLLLFVLWFGSGYVLSPETMAPGFGLPSWPSGDGDGFLVVKGIRDVVMALTVGILLVTGHRRAMGWALLVEAVVPYGDMANVLAHNGSVAAALLIHGLTATLMVILGLLLLRETRAPGRARSSTGAAHATA